MALDYLTIELRSCFYSFFPLVLSLILHIIFSSIDYSPLVIFILTLFIYILSSGLLVKQSIDSSVLIRALSLCYIFLIGYFVAFYYYPLYSPLGLFTIFLAIFHLSEYIAVALWSKETLTLESFLLNHSIEYHAAIASSYVEYILEIKLFSIELKFSQLAFIIRLVGLLMIFSGEFLRKLSIYTAHKYFSHLIKSNVKREEHRLITYGIYNYFRHPSYVGWYFWAVGTQIYLCNPICTIIYIIAAWHFFNQRIKYEEYTLIRCFGYDYINYQERVPVGIPFIRGFDFKHNSKYISEDEVVLLAFLASIGFTFLILGCALSGYNWWGTFVIIFYVLCPIPLSIGRQCANNYDRESSPCMDLMWFLTTIIIVSAFGLPAVLCRTQVILPGSMGFIMAGNIVVFITIAIYFMTFVSDSSELF